MAGKTTIDWGYWKYKYVSGGDEITLEALSRLANAPKLNTLKKQSTEGLWKEERRKFREQAASVAAQAAISQEAVRQTQQILDAAEVLTRHLQMAKALQAIAAQRLKEFRPSDLTAKELVSWISTATNIERLALGLATERKEVDVKIDLSQLSDEQLERLVAGEDPRYLLN